MQNPSHKDIESTNIGSNKVTEDTESDGKGVLHNLRNMIGNSTTTPNKLEKIRPWIIEKPLQAEHDNNYTGVYKEVYQGTLPNRSNIITLHDVYKVKRTNRDKMP